MDIGVCSSGSHHDNVTDASMTMPFKDRLVAHSRIIGSPETLKPLDRLNHLQCRQLLQGFTRANWMLSCPLEQTGGIGIDFDAVRRRLPSEFALRLRRDFNGYGHQARPFPI